MLVVRRPNLDGDSIARPVSQLDPAPRGPVQGRPHQPTEGVLSSG